MAQLNVVAELRLQVWIALLVGVPVQVFNKRIQAFVVRAANPAAVIQSE